MSIKVQRVFEKSVAKEYGIKKGDTIISINDHEINDFIDLQYYTAEQSLELIIIGDNNVKKKITIADYWQGNLGVQPQPHKIKRCVNKCIFCFIDQMPPKLRQSLYIKDDDYLFSFVYGNYISLNNLSMKEYDRISEQQISPLYISVHTTNESLRAKIMGYSKEFDILDKLLSLSDQGIRFHTQIVLIPEINDGQELLATLTELSNPELNTLSIGIVPVGLTKHRENLPHLKQFTKQSSTEVLELVNDFREKNHLDNIYLADEFFLLSDNQIPSNEYYKDFCQLENGIGMIRATIDNFTRNKSLFASIIKDYPATIITGKLSARLLKDIASQLNAINGYDNVKVRCIKNNYFGETVTVAGLLTYKDIAKQVKNMQNNDEVLILNSSMFNTQGYTIDNVHKTEFSKKLNRKILIVDELWNDWSFTHIPE